MNNTVKDELVDLYNALIESEIVFHYGSEIIPYGEITELNISKDGNMDMELNGFEKYKIDYEEFQENHSKEGMNYHTWQQVREFDDKLETLVERNI